MVLKRVEYGRGKVVYVFQCVRCGYEMEVAYRLTKRTTKVEEWNPDKVIGTEPWMG